MANNTKGIFFLVSFIVIASLSKAQTDTTKGMQADSVCINPDHPAEFPGGLQGFYKFLAINVRFPREARDNHEQGKVIVQMIIDKNGSISEARVIRKVSHSIDAEAIRVIKSLPKWKAATNNGVTVRTCLSVPISFTYGHP